MTTISQLSSFDVHAYYRQILNSTRTHNVDEYIMEGKDRTAVPKVKKLQDHNRLIFNPETTRDTVLLYTLIHIRVIAYAYTF